MREKFNGNEFEDKKRIKYQRFIFEGMILEA